MKDKILLQGMFIYKCDKCGHTRFMYLEKGVEGKNKIMPCPFIIPCPICDGDFAHAFWKFDIYLDEAIEIEEGMSYFKLDEKVGHGVPVFDYKENEE